MKSIAQVLENQDSNFFKLLAKAMQTKRMDHVFKKMLDAELAPHCHFAKITKETLAVTVDNASWATRLRYAIPDILKDLQTQPEFQAVKKIRYAISLDVALPARPEKRVKKPKLSPENEKLWRDALESLERHN